MDIFKPDPREWPFEAFIEHPDGREYSQFARDNGDGTVSFISWGEEGPSIQTAPQSVVTLKERPWEKAKRWQNLYAEVYGEKEVEKIFNKESLDKHLRTGRELVARGKLPGSELEELARLEEEFKDTTEEDWNNDNFFFSHFPTDTTDHVRLIARGHFLISQKVRGLGSADRIPRSLLAPLVKLDLLRERVVRGASTQDLAEQVDDFLGYFNTSNLPGDRGEALAQALRNLYGAVCRSARLDQEPSIQ